MIVHLLACFGGLCLFLVVVSALVRIRDRRRGARTYVVRVPERVGKSIGDGNIDAPGESRIMVDQAVALYEHLRLASERGARIILREDDGTESELQIY